MEEPDSSIAISVSCPGYEIPALIENGCTADAFLEQLAERLPSNIPPNPIVVFNNTEINAFAKEDFLRIRYRSKLEVKDKYWTSLGYDSRIRRLSIGECDNNPPLFLGVKKECIMCETNEYEEGEKTTLFEG